ncbi:hypothetical protein LTS18_012849, partial [Coniosporium uncinatum]
PLRLTVNDIFRGGINNPLSISGRIEQGSLQVGEQILVQPAGETAHIKAIELANEGAEWAVAGQIVTLHLTDIDAAHLRQGDIVCSVASPIQNLTSFTAKVLAFEHVLPGYVDVHRGPMYQTGRIERLVALLDKASGEVVKRKPRIVQPGQVVRCVVEVEGKMPLEKGGRVVLRSEGVTVGAGLLE